jgi:hypothetical protein
VLTIAKYNKAGASLFTHDKMGDLELLPTELLSSCPSSFRIASVYLVVIGMIGLILPLLRIGPIHPEFGAQSTAYKIGAQTSVMIVSAATLVAGMGLFWHHLWARNLSLGVLVIGTFSATNEFAWGFSRALLSGPPTPRIRLLSRIVVVAWNAFWFYLIYRLRP